MSDTLDWIRRMPMPRRIDAIETRRITRALSKVVIGGLGRQLGQQNKVIHHSGAELS